MNAVTSEIVPVAPECRCCGSSAVRFWGTKHGRLKPEPFRYYFCQVCGFRYVDPITPADIYNDDYYRGDGVDPYVDYVAELSPGSNRSQEFEDIERILRTSDLAGEGPLAWLDYGCGTGTLLRYFHGRELHFANRSGVVHGEGCDVGSYATRLLSEGFSIHTYDALNRMPGARYDVISAIEVLEHVAEPALAMRLLSRLLKPGGVLILTTGNLDSPVARCRQLAYRYLIPEIHVSLFSPRSLSALYKAHGLDPMRVRYAGVVKYKVTRSLINRRLRRIAQNVLHVPGAVALVDWAYGVSAMPWARKSA